MQKNSVNKSVYSNGFLAMIRDNFDVAVAADICRLANEYTDDYINTHPNAYGSAIKVSYPFAGVYRALQKYVSKEEALQMMKDYAPQIGEKQRRKFWRFTSIPGIPTLIWANFEKITKVAGSEKAGYRSVLYGKKEKKPDSI